ncbi:MAG: NAD-dependent protein deacylase [Alphaproteobacteria bacterium MarineAlpha5_Bin9]|nr:MAG: NAD-dependent protein deacylase [Alphaproteobacteria bacterium MarineAlpha5_Bin9]|tara:strand:+ start:5975 stop:6709 length:735 start_codon:yes stop_codon:yes gene_type:complete
MNIENLPKIKKNSNVFVLTGAGISKESGIETFRDNKKGLWNKHKIEDVATLEGFIKNPEKVYEFYNLRRKELNSHDIKPNKAHIILKYLEKYLNINIITQNIDNLHEKAGSNNIYHMHGELNKVKCLNKNHIFEWTSDLTNEHKCNICGSAMRPDIVWFGEIPYFIDQIEHLTQISDIFISIGTSGEVYPAAGFVDLFKRMNKITIEFNLEKNLNSHKFDFSNYDKATISLNKFKNLLTQQIII